MKFSISIMAHPSRSEMVDYIKASLKDDYGDVPVAWDDGCGIWENCKKAWRLRDPESDYHLVLQDDAILCKEFVAKTMVVLFEAMEKGCASSLFFGKRTLLMDVGKQALKTGWVTKAMLHWGIAVILPTNLIEEMIAFGDKLNIPQDDARISYFLQSKKIPIYYPVPSLIEHRCGKSLVNDPGQNRVAYKFIDDI